MLSNKLTFSLASLVMLLAFGLVFGTGTAWAHEVTADNTAADAIPTVDDPHPLNTADTHTHPKFTISASDADPSSGTQVVDKDSVTSGIQFDIMVTAPLGATTPADAALADATIGGTDLGVTVYNPTTLLSVGTVAIGAKQTVATADILATAADADEQFSPTSRMWTRTVTVTIPDGDDEGDTTTAEEKAAIDAGLMVTVTVNPVLIMSGQVTGPMMGQANLMQEMGFKVISESYIAPDNVEITSTSKAHGGNDILVKFTVTPATTGGTPAMLEAGDIKVTNGYVRTDSFRNVTPTPAPTDGSKVYQASVAPDPISTKDLIIDLKMDMGFGLKTGTTVVTVPHTALDPTDPTIPRDPAKTDEIRSQDYAVILQAGATSTGVGIRSTANVQVLNYTFDQDLQEFFRIGGTIVLMGPANTAVGALKITEIMWGRDAHLGTAAKNSQWIEVYNTGTTNITWGTGWSLKFVSAPTRDNTAEVTATTAGRVDRVGNLGNPGYWAVPGSSGRTVAATGTNAAPTQTLVSMYRKLNLLPTTTDKAHGADDGDPQKSAAWVASGALSVNMTGERSGTPGAPPSTRIGATPATIDRSTVYITEIGNSTNDAHDWIEIYNATSADVNIKNWIISVVDKSVVDGSGTNAAKTDAELDASENGGTLDLEQVRFRRADGYDGAPDALNLPAMSYLVIAASNPTADGNPLSGGIDLEKEGVDRDRKTNETQGLTSLYYVEPKLKLPTGPHMVILRNNHEKEGTSDNVRDVVTVGNFFRRVEIPNKWDTDVWPLQATPKPGDLEDHATLTAGSASYVMTKRGAVADHNKNAWAHKDTWNIASYSGLGYDRGSDMVGTPGYDNGGVKEKVADLAGDAAITISEIMVDSGRSLPQWIELYNSSMTQAVTLNGWTLEIYNYPSEDVSNTGRINAIITLPDKKVLPNQTVLIVSTEVGRASRGHFPDERVIDLYNVSDDPFDRENRRDPILSSTGFRLVLIDKDKKVVDEAGNIDDDRRRVDEPTWMLPTNGGDERSSLIRRYDNGVERIGTEDDAWVLASETDLSFAHNADTYYGNPDDIGTPGFRGGGPLPVELSTFRPLRDKATGAVVIRWATESELDNAGFNILRSETKTGEFKVVNLKGIIPGHGTTSEKHVYEWKDTTAKPNVVYYYQIEDVSLDGKRTTLRTTHLRGNVTAAGKATTRWGELKDSRY